ncbi:signal transduction histidine-protein kinase/phosphatase MprB [mine drainage metagenome]|uniref:histidine kinase n=1 Tax=mine drainage metagenome TaxID=410659 RepID=A0A1J5QZV7_9ZZZZ
MLRSFALRLALAYALVFILSALGLGGFLWWRTAAYLDHETDAVILADIQAVGDQLREFGLPGAISAIRERVGKAADSHAIYLLADPALRPVAGNLDAWPLAIRHKRGWRHIPLAARGRIHDTKVFYLVLSDGYHLLVGRDVEDRTEIRTTILGALGWAALTALLLAAGGGLLLRRTIFRRVEAITRATTAIMRGDLSNRLAAVGSSDEFDRLAQTINGMLQQIEVLVDGVRNASNAVAHDLRTPLAELRGRLEALLRSPPGPEAMLQEVAEAVADLDRLIAVFNALLRLAEIDSGARLAGFCAVRLDQILIEVAELYGAVAEDKGVTLTLIDPPALEVRGDPSLLAQAVGNLIDNAVKYSPAGGNVTLGLTPRGDGGLSITVTDDGPGIPAAEKLHATDRFYRGSAGDHVPGLGLGLCTVAAIMRLHGGSLILGDNSPGLAAVLDLPAQAV